MCEQLFTLAALICQAICAQSTLKYAQVIGMRQEYELGQYIRHRYVDTGFIRPNYTVEDIYVVSTYNDRAIMSAQCMLAGLYPPSGYQKWNPTILWQPIPIHTIPLKQDFLLKLKCPTYNALELQVAQSQLIRNLTIKYKDLIDLIGIHSGYKPTFESLIDMIDPIFVENAHNLTFPKWLRDNDVYKRFVKLKDLKAQLKFPLFEMAKIKGGPLLGEMIKNMKEATNVTKIQPKIMFYSAHDTNMNALLSVMRMFNNIHVIYAAALFVELHHTQGQGHTVEFHYRNDSTTPPVHLLVPGCGDPCKLAKFQQLMHDVTPKDPVASCLGYNPTKTCPPIGGLTSQNNRDVLAAFRDSRDPLPDQIAFGKLH